MTSPPAPKRSADWDSRTVEVRPSEAFTLIESHFPGVEVVIWGEVDNRALLAAKDARKAMEDVERKLGPMKALPVVIVNKQEEMGW